MAAGGAGRAREGSGRCSAVAYNTDCARTLEPLLVLVETGVLLWATIGRYTGFIVGATEVAGGALS